jgi:hypothetical protein
MKYSVLLTELQNARCADLGWGRQREASARGDVGRIAVLDRASCQEEATPQQSQEEHVDVAGVRGICEHNRRRSNGCIGSGSYISRSAAADHASASTVQGEHVRVVGRSSSTKEHMQRSAADRLSSSIDHRATSARGALDLPFSHTATGGAHERSAAVRLMFRLTSTES